MVQTYRVFDFLPAEATAPITVATLITGGRVKGLLRERQLRRLPHRRCLLIGEAVVAEVLHIILLLFPLLDRMRSLVISRLNPYSS